MIFPIRDASHAIWIYNDSSSWLVSIGSDGGWCGHDDINIMKYNKQHSKPGNGCIPYSYQYNINTNCNNDSSDSITDNNNNSNNSINALCSSDTFDIKQFIVIQMI